MRPNRVSRNASVTVSYPCLAPVRSGSVTPRSETSRSRVVREQRPNVLVERRSVATRDGHGRQCTNGRRPRHVHRQRDLAEIIARSQHALGPATSLADREHAAEDDIETVAVLTFRDDTGAGGNVFPDHVLSKPRKCLARKRGGQPDPRQLVLGRAGGPWAHPSRSSSP